MHLSSMRSVIMNKENAKTAKVEGRITRAQSKALGIVGGICSSSRTSFKPDQKRSNRMASKRAASDENRTSNIGLQHKKRAVLKDVSNICSENIYMDCINKSKVQIANHARKSIKKNPRVAAHVITGVQRVENDSQSMLADELSKITMVAAQETGVPTVLEENKPVKKQMCRNKKEGAEKDPLNSVLAGKPPSELQTPVKKEDENCEKLGVLGDHGFVDIDKDKKNPLVCCLYAPDIYNNIRVAEHNERPSIDYMERVQRDINPSMRGILIDWLVEVSEEYKLVPDTLYLTVNLIDRFLSHNHVEKQRLQLLGVTCMLIASKYEEICAPRVEEFCFITDNTYTRGEVLKMESEVLNFLHFQLSMPTTKTFLRRFIQAAQASYKAPCVELEFLANYLAELTLLEYQFLKFLPSRIAASAVLLARWTLNQSDDPWNRTLEHYTNYKASELKTTVLALEDLQRNTKGCSLNAIREKYKQQKFKCVATLSSLEGAHSLFSR